MRWSARPKALPKSVGEPAPKGLSETIRGAVVILEAVVPPASLIVGWSFWFAFSYTSSRFSYFGIDSSLLGLTTTDYILRSGGAMIVPAVVFLLITLIVASTHGIVTFLITTGRGHAGLRALAWCTLVLGVTAGLMGVQNMFSIHPWPNMHYLVPPILLGGGFATAAYASAVLWNLLHPGLLVPIWMRWTQVIAVALLALGLLWGTNSYASALGRGSGMQAVEYLKQRPAVTIFSKNQLELEVNEFLISPPQNLHTDFHYSYSGLRLLFTNGDQYILLPEDWLPGTSRAIVLKDRPEIRIEYGR